MQLNKHAALDEAVDRFQGDLRWGRLEAEWRANAKTVGVKRARGDFNRQDVPSEDENDDELSDDSSEASSDDEWLDKFEDDFDREMENGGEEGKATAKHIPKRLSIFVHED